MKKYELEFDRKANKPENYVVNELHDLSLSTVKIIFPTKGVYYLKDLEVYKQSDLTKPLVYDVDYVRCDHDPDIIAATGLENGVAIRFKDTSLKDKIAVTYRAVGGSEGTESALVDRVQKSAEILKGDPTIDWTDLVPPPMPPRPHTHKVTELTDLEVVKSALVELKEALVNSYTLGLTGNSLNARVNRVMQLLGDLRVEMNTYTLSQNVPTGLANASSRIDNLTANLVLLQSKINTIENDSDDKLNKLMNNASNSWFYDPSTANNQTKVVNGITYKPLSSGPATELGTISKLPVVFVHNKVRVEKAVAPNTRPTNYTNSNNMVYTGSINSPDHVYLGEKNNKYFNNSTSMIEDVFYSRHYDNRQKLDMRLGVAKINYSKPSAMKYIDYKKTLNPYVQINNEVNFLATVDMVDSLTKSLNTHIELVGNTVANDSKKYTDNIAANLNSRITSTNNDIGNVSSQLNGIKNRLGTVESKISNLTWEVTQLKK